MKKRFSWVSISLLQIGWLVLGCQQAAPKEAISLAPINTPYKAYALQTADYYIDSLDGFMAQWRTEFQIPSSGEFKPTAVEMYLAALYANLYEDLGSADREYLEAAKTICLRYGEYKSLFLQEDSLRIEYQSGIPTVPDFFQIPKYARACEVLITAGVLSTAERQQLEIELAESADFLMVTQEWGPMNRAMLRAEGLLYVAKLLPQHPRHHSWEDMGNAILKDNLENWSIEDAGMYGMIWMYSLCGYANDVAEDPAVLNTATTRYYFEYYKELLCPAGVIPDYGDGWWRSWWFASVPVFETGALLFNNQELKWAAEYTFERNVKKEGHSISLALKYLEASMWGNPSLVAKTPNGTSQQVLEDQIGKKVVFRNGYDPEDAYLLLNYKDEGSDGWLYRENLRNTLSVAHEKMHHGHSDENSIVFLMQGKSVLLRDGGYRDAIPSGEAGSYRADIFHNRLVARKGQPEEHQSAMDFLKNEGFYVPSRTQKIDFYTSSLVHHSRTRLVDESTGFVHDRIVDYIPSKGLFVVSDVVEASEEGTFTFSTLWHGQQVINSGSNWAITRYDSIGKWQNTGKHRLYLHLLQKEPIHKEIVPLNRHKQQEYTLCNTQSRFFEKGAQAVFVTVLLPLDEGQKAPDAKNLRFIQSDPNVIGIRIAIDHSVLTLAHKVDLQQDLQRQWPKPRYTAQSGTWSMEGFTTDAQSFYALETETQYHIVAANTTEVALNGGIVFKQAPVTNEYRLDGGPATAAPWKVRMIDKVIEKH